MNQDKTNLPAERIVKKHTVYKGKIFDVLQYDMDFSGNKISYELIKFRCITGVSILPIDAKGNIILIKQYHAGIEAKTYTLPSGGLNPGEDPEIRAQLELQEEIGYRAKSMKLMTRSVALPGYISDEAAYIYLAEGLEPSKLEGDEPFTIERYHMPIDDAIKLVKAGEIYDSRTAYALLYYKFLYMG